MRRQHGRGVMRTLQAASWWLLFGQPPPAKTLKSKISKSEPPPLSNAERNPNSAGSEISVAKRDTSKSDHFTITSS